MTSLNEPQSSRRRLIASSASGLAATLAFAGLSSADAAPKDALRALERKKRQSDSSGYLSLKDGTELYYKDWGSGPTVVFSHGWPLDADAWDAQLIFLASKGFRVVAHDRRGHGRSSQTWDGNDMDTYANDLAELIEYLDLKDITLVGHSTGGGEVARYVGLHGTKRVSKAILISSVGPFLLQGPTNPVGAPISVFDGIRQGLLANRAQFFYGLATNFFGYNLPGATSSQGVIQSFWNQGMLGSIKSEYDCIKAFSETNFTPDLQKMTFPVLVIQGDADQIVPIGLAAQQQVKILPNPTLKVYPGAPHGLCVTHADQVNADLLAFLQTS